MRLAAPTTGNSALLARYFYLSLRLSVCPSVSQSKACIVTKRNNPLLVYQHYDRAMFLRPNFVLLSLGIQHERAC